MTEFLATLTPYVCHAVLKGDKKGGTQRSFGIHVLHRDNFYLTPIYHNFYLTPIYPRPSEQLVQCIGEDLDAFSQRCDLLTRVGDRNRHHGTNRQRYQSVECSSANYPIAVYVTGQSAAHLSAGCCIATWSGSRAFKLAQRSIADISVSVVLASRQFIYDTD